MRSVSRGALSSLLFFGLYGKAFPVQLVLGSSLPCRGHLRARVRLFVKQDIGNGGPISLLPLHSDDVDATLCLKSKLAASQTADGASMCSLV